MEALSDPEFGKMFFAEINPDHPDLQEAKPALAKGDFPAALGAWARRFVARLRAMPLAPWSGHNWKPLDPIMRPDTVVMHHGKAKDFGPPGKMDWYGLRDWELHVNFMWHPKAITKAIEENAAGRKGKYTNEQLYTRWAAIWRDFCSNNWRLGLPFAGDAELRRRTLAAAGLAEPPHEWGSQVGFRQQLCVSWLLGNWFADLQHASLAAPADFERSVSPRLLAEMAYFMLVWPTENLTDGGKATAARLVEGVPNQFHEKTTQLLRLGLLLPEFHRGARLSALAQEAVRVIIGMEGHRTPNSDCHPDGSGTENSLNYMRSLVPIGGEWLILAKTLPAAPDWSGPLRGAVELRRRFMAHLGTPTGSQVLCKGIHEKKGDPVGRAEPYPPYTSIAFPWHGLYMMRGAWGENALFLSLHNPRRGQGHEADDGNKIMLEAFGRYLLVASGGEDAGRFCSSSWAQNTVNVDGLGQARTAWPRAGAYDRPQPGRWHTSPHFDFAESTYTGGYGAVAGPGRGTSPVKIADVRHTRQAIFAREAGIWIVTDILEAPPEAEHAYAQVWCFHKDFPRESVTADPGRGLVATREANRPNLSLHQAGPMALTYRSFYGEGNTTGDARPRGDRLPDSARGWHNAGSGYDAGDVHPAVNVHAEWTGRGRQTLVTAIVPSLDTRSPVTSAEPLKTPDTIGLALRLGTGATVLYEASLSGSATPLVRLGFNAASGVRFEKVGASVRGLRLGPADTDGSEFVLENGVLRDQAPVLPPQTFRWTGPPGEERPLYR
jgi:hypothetical protein